MNDREGLGSNSAVFLVRCVDEDNVELVAQSDTLAGASATYIEQPEELEKILNGPFSRPASASFSGEPINYRGVPVIVTAKPLEGTDLSLVLSYDVAESLQPVREFQNSLLGFGLFVEILVGAISVLFRRSLTSPILHLVEVVAEIRNGKLERRADVRSSDEIGLLARSFNEMTNEFVNTNATLEERVARRSAD